MENNKDETLHYFIMANHMLVQKTLAGFIKDSGLTMIQNPKVPNTASS